MNGRADAIADLRALWERVHTLLDATYKGGGDPLYRIYLEGAEDVLDWLLGSRCPNGDTRPDADPIRDDSGFRLALVPDGSAEDVVDENGGVIFAPVCEALRADPSRPEGPTPLARSRLEGTTARREDPERPTGDGAA